MSIAKETIGKLEDGKSYIAVSTLGVLAVVEFKTDHFMSHHSRIEIENVELLLIDGDPVKVDKIRLLGVPG